jgi:oxygen-independent coproporphyrinogen-3 oxidase
VDVYVDALIKELRDRVSELEGECVSSVYFGGGTPSVLSLEQMKKVVLVIREEFELGDDVEFTVEANPDDLSELYLEGLLSLGVNRLSIGIQSFREEDLELMRRSHNAKQALECVSLAQKVGIENISIDLIYGIPGLSIEAWEENLNVAVELGIQHLSAYHLTFEEGTVFGHWLQRGKMQEVSDDISEQHFSVLRKLLSGAGFDHYEISNFAKQGYMSRHNRSYWQGLKYLGVGPGAHSYNGIERRWNVSSVKKYSGIEACEKLFEKEILSEEDRLLEYVMVSLRRKEGIDLTFVQEEFGEEEAEELLKGAMEFIDRGEMEKRNEVLRIKREFWLLGDWITGVLVG